MGKGRWNHNLISQNNYHKYIIKYISFPFQHVHTHRSVKLYMLIYKVFFSLSNPQLMFLSVLVKSQKKIVNVNFELFSESFLECLT